MKAFVTALIRMLHDTGLCYGIGGSIASSYYGEPRTTQDIDLSIQLDQPDVPRLLAGCEAHGWYISPEEITRAVQEGGSFSTNDGFWKADFFVVRGEPFDVEALNRRQEKRLALIEQTVWMLTAEDVIVHKLRWCEGQPLDKHLRDIAAILHVQNETLDLAYITRWAAVFGAGELWAGLLDAYRRRGE